MVLISFNKFKCTRRHFYYNLIYCYENDMYIHIQCILYIFNMYRISLLTCGPLSVTLTITLI